MWGEIISVQYSAYVLFTLIQFILELVIVFTQLSLVYMLAVAMGQWDFSEA